MSTITESNGAAQRNKSRLQRVFRQPTSRIAPREWTVTATSVTHDWIQGLLSATAALADVPATVARLPAATNGTAAEAAAVVIAVDPQVVASRQQRFGFKPESAVAVEVAEAAKKRAERFGISVAADTSSFDCAAAGGATAGASQGAAVVETEEQRAAKARRLERFGALASPAATAVVGGAAAATTSVATDAAAAARAARFAPVDAVKIDARRQRFATA